MSYPGPDLEKRLSRLAATVGMAMEVGGFAGVPDIEALFALTEAILEQDEPSIAGFSDLPYPVQETIVTGEAWAVANRAAIEARALSQGRNFAP